MSAAIWSIPSHLRSPADIGTSKPTDITNRIRLARYRRKLAMLNLVAVLPFELDAEGVSE